jgi:hypothetical protein
MRGPSFGHGVANPVSVDLLSRFGPKNHGQSTPRFRVPKSGTAAISAAKAGSAACGDGGVAEAAPAVGDGADELPGGAGFVGESLDEVGDEADDEVDEEADDETVSLAAGVAVVDADGDFTPQPDKRLPINR